MMAASASSFPPRGHATPFGRRAPPPPPLPRRGAAARRSPPVSAHGCGGEGDAGRILDPRATPFQILGLDTSASYSAAQLKAAFRARVKEFHPDVCKDPANADLIMRRVIEAYQMLSGNQEMMVERNNIDPFDEPECEACDIFVNELLCIGTGCPYSCVRRAPHVFAFSDDIGTAHAISQGNGEDDLVQLAVGQCPRKCIYYVTPCQHTILEDVLASVLMAPYDLAEAAVLDSFISKARFENNKQQFWIPSFRKQGLRITGIRSPKENQKHLRIMSTGCDQILKLWSTKEMPVSTRLFSRFSLVFLGSLGSLSPVE